MKTALLLLLCLMVTCPAVAGTLKQDVEELYRPADAQTMKLMAFLPPQVSRAAVQSSGGGGRCPQNINIGAAQSQQNRMQRFDATVVIDAPVVIQCR
jgi:hypothetical protein